MNCSRNNRRGNWYGEDGYGTESQSPVYSFSVCPPHIAEKRLIKKQATMLSFCMVLMFFISFFIQTMLSGILTFANPQLLFNELIQEIIVTISYVVSVTVPFCIFGAYTKIPVDAALRRREVPVPLTLASLGVTLGVSVVGMYASMAVTGFFSQLGISFEVGFSDFPVNYGAMVLYVINMTIVPAILEEIAFRGFIMQSLRRFGDGFALFASAFVFSLIHVTPDRLPHTFIMGLAIGYFVLFTGSLKTGIIIHFVYNLIVTVLSIGYTYLSADFFVLNMVSEIIMLVVAVFSLIYFIKNYGGMFSLRKGRNVNPQSVNIKCFVFSNGMWIFYAVMLIMTFRSMVIL